MATKIHVTKGASFDISILFCGKKSLDPPFFSVSVCAMEISTFVLILRFLLADVFVLFSQIDYLFLINRGMIDMCEYE